MTSHLATRALMVSLLTVLACGDDSSSGSGAAGGGGSDTGGSDTGGAGGSGGAGTGATGGGSGGIDPVGGGGAGASGGAGGAGAAGGAGGGGLGQFGDDCVDNTDCESGLCHLFNGIGAMVCTQTCMSIADCPPEASMCNNMGLCRP